MHIYLPTNYEQNQIMILQNTLLFVLFLTYAADSKSINERVMGGHNASAGQFRFAAAIYKATPTGNYFCTGTLYNQQWIITAGNCVDNATTFVILLGSLRLGTPDSSAVRVSTDDYVLHPNYDGSTLQNNIGLIRLRMPLVLNDYIRPVDYLPNSSLMEGTQVQTVGWGQMDDDDESSLVNDHLNFAFIISISNSECKLVYGDQITDSMVCAQGNLNEGACSGDVGGPLIQTVSRGYNMLVGIANFVSNNGCGSLDPSGYTRVYNYVDWIKNVTRIVE